MTSLLKWALLAAVLTAFLGSAEPARAMCAAPGTFAANGCTAGKIKCALGKKSCLFGCYKKAAGGAPVDPACLAKCRGKFDGAGIAAKSCFGKLEAKGGCLTTLDTAAIEHKIDGFVEGMIATLHNTQPVGTGNKCLAGKINCLIGYNKCRLGIMSGAAKKGLKVALGPAPDIAAKFQKCLDKINACYAKLELKPPCLTSGDVGSVVRADDLFIDDLIAELVAGQRDMNTQRCTGDTSVTCTNAPGGTGGPCTGLGTCEYWFGSTLPLSAGGISTCVSNQWSGTINGTANPETGASAGTALLIARVYNGIAIDNPCPRCVNDYIPNDDNLAGCPLGTCDGGVRNGLPCDVNGISPNPSFGSTSLDCPPNPGALIATLPVNLSNTNTGNAAITLSASSPNCNGAPGKKCACATCSGDASRPCRSDFDCQVTPVVGTCTGTAGEPRRPNACLDDTNTADDCTDSAPVGDGEGECSAGPTDTHCAIETQRGCLGPLDCPAPGDYCAASPRPCYLDQGVIGGKVEAQGSHTLPINHWSHPTFASVFCVAPTGSSAVNIVAGLPGPGRLELGGEAVDNGTAGACPTSFTFLPTSTGGVLDTGWSGIAHNATAIGQGKVTVGVTGCANATPPCGNCTYAGPIPNANAIP